MFFIFSKLLNVFLSPLVWAIILFVLSFFVRTRLKKPLKILSLVVLLFFSNVVIFNSFAGIWEIKPVKPTGLSGDARTVVVLGGMASENKGNGLPRFAESSDRLWQGLWLLKKGYANDMIISGGRGDLFDKQRSESDLIQEYLSAINVLDSSITIESHSRNTFENARNTAKIFKQNGKEKTIILVTSAFHMRRARACFEKQGFSVTVFPADPLSEVRPFQWYDYIIPSSKALDNWETLIREWTGMIMYKINGYI